jgi:hypothetical protein
MDVPLLKNQSSLLRADFDRHPVWVRVHDYDREQPWYGDSTDQTYRPWEGPLPLQPRSPFHLVLVAASFRLSNGDSYPGYFNPATTEWDVPLPPRKIKDGSYTASKQWSARRGGSPLSILAIHRPVIFIGEGAYDFQLRHDLDRRKRHILDVYAAIGRRPKEVFPVTFSADPALFSGIVSGHIDGFYSFPLDRPFEIDRGENYLSVGMV